MLFAIILAANAALIVHLRDSELRVQEQQLSSLNLVLAEQADREFQSVDLILASVVDYMSGHGVIDQASLKRHMAGQNIHTLLKEKISGVPQLDAVTIIDAEGRLVNFSRYWPIPPVRVTDRDYFQALKADHNLRTFISAPVQNRGTGTWTIYLARRVNAPDGSFLGLVLGAMQLSYFEDFYRTVAPGDQSSSIVLVRRDGMMLARFPSAPGVGAFFGAERILGNGALGTVIEPSPIDGSLRLKAARAATHYPVFVLVTNTEKAALAHWRQIARLLSGVALICGLSVVAAGVALGRRWRIQADLAKAQREAAEAERARALAEAELQRQREMTAAFEALRRAKEEAEAANLAKTEFLANISHELRTPLNAIIGFSELMVKEAMGPLGHGKYREYARDIHFSGAHLLDIINDILDLTKASTGALELVERPVNVRPAVEAVCRLIQPRIREANLSLDVVLPTGELLIQADERKLTQILLNLLSNASKFTPSGGRVECCVTITTKGIEFKVSDTGIGIPEEHLDRVLQPFVQVESSYRRTYDGAGLGLAIVKTMTELHGGTLTLQSKQGVGTSAVVTLPRERLLSINTDMESQGPSDHNACCQFREPERR